MKKSIKYSLLLLVVTLLGLSSCSKNALDKVNKNPNNPTDVPTRLVITDIMTSTAFSVVGGDIPLYSSIYIEHEAGVWNQQYSAEIRQSEPTSATTYDNVWNSIYANIKGLNLIIAKTSTGGEEEGNDVTCGIAKVLLAYNLGILTDYWGDVPFSETGITAEDGTPTIFQPKIDKQEDLYPQILSLLDEGIALLDGSNDFDGSPLGKQDLIYGGKTSLWKKAAYGLKARYTMHTLFRSQNVNQDLTNILDYVSKSFVSPDEQMEFAIYDGDDQVNPLAAFSVSREGLGSSASLVKKFQALNDPRGDQSFSDWNLDQLSLGDALAGAVPNGNPIQQQEVYDFSFPEFAFDAPTLLLSYHEVKFLEAEALVRLGQKPDAEAPLKEGIEAAFANLERTLKSTSDLLPLWFGVGISLNNPIDLSASVADDYFNDEVLPNFNTDALGTVMLQKYLAFFGASGESTEAYNDVRRLMALGEDSFITLDNPNNATKFPLRYTYGNSDVIANPNIATAYGNGQYVYTENVWWAGGNR